MSPTRDAANLSERPGRHPHLFRTASEAATNKDHISNQGIPPETLSLYFGQSRAKAAGGAPGVKAGHSVHPLHEAGEHSVMSRLYKTAANFKAKLEADPQWKVGQFSASNGARSGTVQGAGGSSESGARLSGSPQADHGAGLARRGGVEVPTVEPHIEGSGNRCNQGLDTGRPSIGPLCNSSSMPQASHCASLPVQTQIGRDDDDSGHIRHGHIAAQSKLHTSMGCPKDSAKQCGVSANRHELQDGGTRQKSHGTADPGSDVWSAVELHDICTQLAGDSADHAKLWEPMVHELPRPGDDLATGASEDKQRYLREMTSNASSSDFKTMLSSLYLYSKIPGVNQ